MDGSKHLVWLSRKCTVLEEGSEGGTTFGQVRFSCSHNGGFHGRFTGLTDAFEQHRPCVFGLHMRQLFIDFMAAPPKSISTSPPACIVSLNIHALKLQRLLFIHNLMLEKKYIFTRIWRFIKAKPP